ncbi:MAG TPA: TetR/AcrR family transcriptional regulator [Candidatus Aquilonibacter sp.]|nr:TetR/AcrR family transcriptional regulator [Candidatus Aquilonibacter sp.]
MQLAREGIESVRVEVLARRLGVSKGSFYWHFRDRDELLMQMLDRWERSESEWLAAEESNESEKPAPAARWARFVERTVEPERIREEIGVRAWARRDERVATRVVGVETRKVHVIAGVLGEIGFAAEAAESLSELVSLVCLGWLDRSARDGNFRSAGRGLGEFLSDLVLAASAKVSAANR